jgi:hypothetical protein
MRHSELAGADLHAPSNQLVENDTGSTITVLTCVTYVGIGTQGLPSIVPADGTIDQVRGIAQTDILSDTNGMITALGFLIGTIASPIDTSAWIEGTRLYANSSGQLTTTPTGALVATVYKQDTVNGVMYVENAFQSGSGTGNVIGPVSSTDRAIASWNGTTGEFLRDNPNAIIQPSGAINAQAIIYDRQILQDVIVPDNNTMICNDIELISGDVILEGSATLLLL